MRSRRLPLGTGGGGTRRDRGAASPEAAPVSTNTTEKQIKKLHAPAASPKTELRNTKAAANGSSPKPPPSSEKRTKPNTTNTTTPPPLSATKGGGSASDHKMTESRSIKSESRNQRESHGEKKSHRENSKKRKILDTPSLKAIMPHSGAKVSVNIVVNGKRLTAEEMSSLPSSNGGHLGNDGNQYYCQVCRGFGDVVCCDGCPRVYHRTCVPSGPSRDALDNDEDPWFCPQCIGKKKSRRAEKEDRASSQHRCVDCHKTIEGLTVEPCEECGNYVHYPSCRPDGPEGKRALCSTCYAVDALSQEDEKEFEEQEAYEEQEDMLAEEDSKPTEISAGAGHGPESDQEGEASKQGGVRRKKRKPSVDESGRKNRKDGVGSAKKKKKKKPEPPPSEEEVSQGSEPQEPFSPSPKVPPIAQATPAFYFYMAENRWKIERVLSKRSRAFNRLSRGKERNALVAKEAAIWWSKLRPSDHKRYVNMSMRDFESRVIEWKEDKHIREMSLPEVSKDMEPHDDTRDYSEEDRRLTVRKHKRLYISTSVGSKVFKPELDQNYNRVLLDLIHDSRFHPLPMLSLDQGTEAEEKDYKDDPASRVLIPHFEVHGPVSTSVGDECLGCLRGWVHHCPVLRRRIPAVEPRAKLQPPMSSLLATRIGLGVRQPIWKKELPPTEESLRQPILFETSDSDEHRRLKDLQVLPSATLDDTNERMDDVVEFIEQAIAMRVPEPPRPEDDPTFTKAMKALPGRVKDVGESSTAPHKCGRCRAILKGDTGCFQCRRAQLVINLAKRNKQEGGKILRVQTTMLGRINLQDRSESQSTRDQAVASGMLNEKWMPSTVLEPQTTYEPSKSNRVAKAESVRGTDSSDDSSSAELEAEDATAELKPAATFPIRNEPKTDTDRPVRSARSTPSFSETYEPSEHQAVLESNRKQVNSFHRRVVTIACCGMLQALLRRDPLNLFRYPVTVEGYLDVVKNPIDFLRIRNKVLKDGYHSAVAFCADVKLLCENAILYNHQNTIYARTAAELLELLSTMQKSAVKWISTMRDAYARYLAGDEVRRRKMIARLEEVSHSSEDEGDPFEELRQEWPEAVEMFENEEWIKAQVTSDFTRTKENEVAFYGSLAISRAAVAAEASLAPYTDSKGVFNVVGVRSHLEDAAIRERVDKGVAQLVGPPQLKEPSTWREESVHRLLRRLQSRRLDANTASEQNCSKCDGLDPGQDFQITMKAEQAAGKSRSSVEHRDLARVNQSRMDITTGLASANNRAAIDKRRDQTQDEQFGSVNESCVSVRGSNIHGWGLYADQVFQKNDVVAEYVGEYINNDTAEEREKHYREQRIQDYMFRVTDDLVIDATMKGGKGRYANHSCGPNCYAKHIPVEGSEVKKRVMIIALKKIKVNEEITYDYQFPLELELDNRIPCNCRAETCRGFMNWDLPERGSVTPLLVQKRGANMRDRIRRLGRPLKRDEN